MVNELAKTPYDPTLRGRLGSLVSRVYDIRTKTDVYERILGEYTNPNCPTDEDPVGVPSTNEPTVFDLVRRLEVLVSDIEITQSNLSNIIQ